MTYPSLIALRVEEAKSALAHAGMARLGILHTAPPGAPPSGPLRVIRERSTPDGTELVVAAELLGPERSFPGQ